MDALATIAAKETDEATEIIAPVSQETTPMAGAK
jgi:hypothetical protein